MTTVSCGSTLTSLRSVVEDIVSAACIKSRTRRVEPGRGDVNNLEPQCCTRTFRVSWEKVKSSNADYLFEDLMLASDTKSPLGCALALANGHL